MAETDSKQQSSLPTSPREWLFIVAISPLLLLLGFHVAGLAILLRKYLRIPYIVGVSALIAGSSCPLILMRGHHPIWIPLAVILVVQVLLLTRHASECTKQDLLDGGNVDHIVPAHMLLCMMYFSLPALYAARDAHHRHRNKISQDHSGGAVNAGFQRQEGFRCRW